ncbi:hypothetical protein AX17_002339 [Amanita inopinata Kibby_2008]|nr:hypothetical protein AX17_002339 [Amanita inopinata Kibby_2008]
MPAYARSRQDYATTAPGASTSTRNATDRLQPFREPNSHLKTHAVAGSSRHTQLANDQTSPVTPAVTGIVYPTEEDEDLEYDEPANGVSHGAESRRYPDQNTSHGYDNSRSHSYGAGNKYKNREQAHTYNNANMTGSSQDDNSSDQAAGVAAAGDTSLDHIWDAIREKKARKMAKERPKVESLEEITGELALSDRPLHPTGDRPLAASGGVQSYKEPSQAQMINNAETMSVPMPITLDAVQPVQETAFKQLKKRKSIVSFRESRDGRSMNATIELPPEVKKQDIHISFNAKRLVVSWMVIDLTEWEEDDGRIIRERVEQIFQRTLPLGEGTKYEEIKSYMIKNRLIIRYPNMRCIRVEPKQSDDS